MLYLVTPASVALLLSDACVRACVRAPVFETVIPFGRISRSCAFVEGSIPTLDLKMSSPVKRKHAGVSVTGYSTIY